VGLEPPEVVDVLARPQQQERGARRTVVARAGGVAYALEQAASALVVGLPLADIDRVTVIVPPLDRQRDDREPITLVTTREKYTDAKVLKALGGDPKKDTSEFHLLVAPVTGGVGVMPATQTPDFTPLEPTTNDDAVANDDAPEA
jgi:hypothetical protein